MTTADDRLKSFADRIERLNSEKDALLADTREVYAELKAAGYDPKIMRQCIRLRKIETSDRQEQEALLDAYMNALGMTGTPLGDFAAKEHR